MHRALMSVAILGVLLFVSSCGRPSEGALPPKQSPTKPVAFNVTAHCGVQYVTIDGRTWETKRRADKNGNPPEGWPHLIRGELARVSPRTAIFTSDEIPVRLVFHPDPNNTRWICG